MERTSQSVPVLRFTPPESPVRSPYFFQDPIRLAAMLCAGLLMWVDHVPFILGLFAVGVSQFNGIAMIAAMISRGWSKRFGKQIRSSLFTSCLATDWVNVSVCTLVGAMFLMRMFGPPMLVTALGWLTMAVALVPDIRFCRVIMPQDPRQANVELTDGWFFRDPVKLGAMAAMVVVCFLDRTSLAFIFVSMVMLQLNAMLIMVDKYLTEVEARGRADVPFRMMRFALDRDGQRLFLTLVPMLMVPLRLLTPDTVAQYAAAGIAALIVVPDVIRAIARIFGAAANAMPFRPKTARVPVRA